MVKLKYNVKQIIQLPAAVMAEVAHLLYTVSVELNHHAVRQL